MVWMGWQLVDHVEQLLQQQWLLLIPFVSSSVLLQVVIS